MAVSPIVSRFDALKAEDLPAEWGPFRRQDFQKTNRGIGSSFGEFSRTWRYQFGEYTASSRWITPSASGTSWRSAIPVSGSALLGRRVVRDEDPAAGRFRAAMPIVEANLANPPGRNGYLLFGLFNQRNQAPGASRDDNLRGRPREASPPGSSRGTSTAVRGGSVLPSYQVQLYVESEYPLTPAEQDQALAFFRHVSPIIRRLGPGAEGGKS